MNTNRYFKNLNIRRFHEFVIFALQMEQRILMTFEVLQNITFQLSVHFFSFLKSFGSMTKEDFKTKIIKYKGVCKFFYYIYVVKWILNLDYQLVNNKLAIWMNYIRNSTLLRIKMIATSQKILSECLCVISSSYNIKICLICFCNCIHRCMLDSDLRVRWNGQFTNQKFITNQIVSLTSSIQTQSTDEKTIIKDKYDKNELSRNICILCIYIYFWSS